MGGRGAGGRLRGNRPNGDFTSVYRRLEQRLGGNIWRVQIGGRAVGGGRKRLAGLSVTPRGGGYLPPFKRQGGGGGGVSVLKDSGGVYRGWRGAPQAAEALRGRDKGHAGPGGRSRPRSVRPSGGLPSQHSPTPAARGS